MHAMYTNTDATAGCEYSANIRVEAPSSSAAAVPVIALYVHLSQGQALVSAISSSKKSQLIPSSPLSLVFPFIMVTVSSLSQGVEGCLRAQTE